jgi:hypothetical protein
MNLFAVVAFLLTTPATAASISSLFSGSEQSSYLRKPDLDRGLQGTCTFDALQASGDCDIGAYCNAVINTPGVTASECYGSIAGEWYVKLDYFAECYYDVANKAEVPSGYNELTFDESSGDYCSARSVTVNFEAKTAVTAVLNVTFPYLSNNSTSLVTTGKLVACATETALVNLNGPLCFESDAMSTPSASPPTSSGGGSVVPPSDGTTPAPASTPSGGGGLVPPSDGTTPAPASTPSGGGGVVPDAVTTTPAPASTPTSSGGEGAAPTPALGISTSGANQMTALQLLLLAVTVIAVVWI